MCPVQMPTPTGKSSWCCAAIGGVDRRSRYLKSGKDTVASVLEQPTPGAFNRTLPVSLNARVKGSSI
jgi:hypothetical protein